MTRSEAAGGVEIVLTPAGREAAVAARPVHAAAVRTHLLDRIPPEARAGVTTALASLG